MVGEYQLKATESLTNLPAYADNALVHRAIEEQQSIRAGDRAIPFQGSINFYYYVGDTSALPDGINEDTVEEYQNAFKRLVGDSYQADEWKFVADEYGRIKIEPSTEKPAGGQKPELPATTDDPKPELPATDQSNIGWRRCNTHSGRFGH